jgi:hypothetical protein
MAQIIQTGTAIAVTYGTGIVNSGLGGILGGSLGPRIRRTKHEISKLEAMQDTAKRVKEKSEKELEKAQEWAESGEILLDVAILSNQDVPDAAKQPVKTTADKIQIITEDRFSSALVCKQLDQLKSSLKIDKANQGSSYAQMVMGGAQIAVATSSIGHVAGVVAKAVVGFSFLSSLLYLGASIYGFAVAINQLSDNRNKQTQINNLITQTQSFKTTSKNEEEAFNSVKDSEILMLQHSLDALKAEEALLLQQRNSQGINIIAALLSLAAMALFSAGPQGTVYYALLAGSVLLPLIAIAYSTYSMNEKKYMEELQRLLQKAPSMLELPTENIGHETQALATNLIQRLVSIIVTDNDVRTRLNELLEKLDKCEDAAARMEGLKKLYSYMMQLQERSNKVDLQSRLKVADLAHEDLAPKKEKEVEPTHIEPAWINVLAFNSELASHL